MSFPGKLAPFLPLGGIPPRFPLVKAANITLLRLCHTWTEIARRPLRGAALFFWGVCTCRAGPMCPAEKCVPGGGAHGPRPTGRYVEPRETGRRDAVPYGRDVVPQGHLFRCAPLRDAVPYGWITHLPRRAGPACPAAGYAFSGGTHGSRPTGAYPQKNNAAPPEQRGAALSVHAIANTDGGGLYSPLLQAGTAGGFHLKAEKALTYLETTYHVFFTSPLYTFNEDM